LDGTLREIKCSFGRGIVALRATGGETVLADETLVRTVQTLPDETKIHLRQSVDAQILLHRLIESGAHVSKFELVEPTLKDIFISMVKKENGEQNPRAA
jgi:ABC-2 type transport system ATP-binding protein